MPKLLVQLKSLLKQVVIFVSKMEGFLGFFAFLGAVCLLILILGLYQLCSAYKKSKVDIEAQKHTKG